ncbi:MAG: type II toxin-antitoxin system PemK/MazF family toxin [Nitrospirae bacterium]|nr:type II toxin-antitoxin system PemK/MazF family toxin [Nitrospirota bacterium]
MVTQYDVYLINLDPTIGSEIKKTRPCVVISPDEMNRHLSTVIIAPLTTKSHDYPSRIAIRFKHKTGWIIFDQIRTVDKRRLVKRLGAIDETAIQETKSVIREMLVD